MPRPARDPASPPRAPPLPNRWAVVTAASVVHALHAACTYIAPTTLMSPMRRSLSLSVAQITQPLAVFRLIQALFLVPAGYVLDRAGPQICLRLSITAAALLAPLLPVVTSLNQLIVLQALFALTKLFGGLSALLLITAQAFPDGNRLATATSLLLSGYSLAGFLAPAFIGALSSTAGWRPAFMALSAIFVLVAVPLTFHFLRQRDPAVPPTTAADLLAYFKRRRLSWSRPRLHPLKPSPIAQPNPDVKSPLSKPPPNPQPLFTAPYTAIAVAVVSFSFSLHIVLDHLLVFLNEDFGMPFHKATHYMSLLNLIALFGKLAVGPLADRYNKSLLITAFASLAAVASLLLLDFNGLAFATTANPAKILSFVVFFSIGYAAVFSLTTSVLPELGKKKLGLRANCNLMLLFGSGSLGSYAAALLRSRSGSYKWPFLWNSAAWLLVALTGLFKYFRLDVSRRTPGFATSPSLGASSETD